MIDHNLLKQDPNNSSHLRTTQYISKQKWKFNQNRHFVLFLLSTFWRIYVSPLPRWRRVHAFSARGVILEHAVRCRACFTLPATPARHFFPVPSPLSRRHRFIYLFRCSFPHADVWERMTSTLRAKCVCMHAHVRVWAWSRTSTWGARGAKAVSGLL